MTSIRKYPPTKNATEAIQTVLLNVRNDGGDLRIVLHISGGGVRRWRRPYNRHAVTASCVTRHQYPAVFIVVPGALGSGSRAGLHPRYGGICISLERGLPESFQVLLSQTPLSVVRSDAEYLV